MKKDVEALLAKLRTERDELRLQIHLAGMEAKDEWDELEKKWGGIENRLDDAKESLTESGRELGDNFEIIADEIGSAYRRIRQRIADE